MDLCSSSNMAAGAYISIASTNCFPPSVAAAPQVNSWKGQKQSQGRKQTINTSLSHKPQCNTGNECSTHPSYVDTRSVSVKHSRVL